jgi:hypothetical protein
MDAALDRDRRALNHAVQSFNENEHVVSGIRIPPAELTTFNVGGVHHCVAKSLLTQHPTSLLAQLVSSPNVAVDPSGRILLDRDGETFRHILNYLRGYKPLLSTDEIETLLHDVQYYGLDELYATLAHQIQPHGNVFQYGGGTTLERNRFRSSYCVSLIGERYYMQGKHQITFEIRQCEYVGLGVVSDACACLDQEFHKTAHCCVYYMTGVFYSNYPHHKKEEGLEKFARDDRITITLDMDDKTVSFAKMDRTVRIVQCSTATRLRFAVVMKLDSEVVIVPNTGDSSVLHSTSMEASTADFVNT